MRTGDCEMIQCVHWSATKCLPFAQQLGCWWHQAYSEHASYHSPVRLGQPSCSGPCVCLWIRLLGLMTALLSRCPDPVYGSTVMLICKQIFEVSLETIKFNAVSVVQHC